MPSEDNTDLDNVIEFYHTVWGLKPKDAADQAFEDQRRGENSAIWKARVEQANNWIERHPQASAKQVEPEPIAPVPPVPAPAPAASPNPESAMADPRLVYPKAYAMQNDLNERRAKLAALSAASLTPSPAPQIKPAAVPLEPMYQFYRNGIGLSPEDAMKRASEDYKQGLANANTPDVPVSPAPIKPAAKTPQHLEDANLSSWQSLANFLGYQNAR